MTAAQLAARHIPEVVATTPAKEAGVCVACGASYAIGAGVAPFAASTTFMDGRALRATPGRAAMTCSACAQLFNGDALRFFAKALITEEAVFPLFKASDRAWLLQQPPAAPFAVVFTPAQNAQHMVWRAPLTRDVNFWHVQIGARTVTVNRPRVHASLEATRAIAAAYLAKTGKQLRSPFVSLDYALSDAKTGALLPNVVKFCREQGFAREIQLLAGLTQGDLWAFGPLVFSGGVATQPERMKFGVKRSSAAPGAADSEAGESGD